MYYGYNILYRFCQYVLEGQNSFRRYPHLSGAYVLYEFMDNDTTKNNQEQMENAKQMFRETGEPNNEVNPEEIDTIYSKNALKSLKHFNIVLCVFIIIRMLLFFIFAMPIKTVPNYNNGGGILTAFFYFGPLIFVDLFLTIYLIRILVVTQKTKRNGGFTEQLSNYFRNSLVLFGVWVMAAVGAILFLLT